MIKFLLLTILITYNCNLSESKSIILANYHNVLLFFPKEYGGNDELRVIFDVRNTTIKSFKYLPVVVSVAYDSEVNNAYCYLESATTSYIMLLKWSGGRWCYQILFEFPASQFSKHMYHSVILMDNFIYWSTDRYIMSGRLPNYEKRLLLQPAWNRLYSMTLDKVNRIIYVAAYDYTENALFSCTLQFFSCTKLLSTEFTINYVYFSTDLYITSIQSQYLYRYSAEKQQLTQLNTVQDIMSNLIILDDQFALYTDQLTITMVTNFNLTRRADAHLIDPYALQYVFSANKVFEFDTYPNWLIYPEYQNILYRNNLYLFYFYVCGMDYVENDLEFIPQMDLNNRFLSVQSCENRFYKEHIGYMVPAIIAGFASLALISLIVLIFVWRYRLYRKRLNRLKPIGLDVNHLPKININPKPEINNTQPRTHHQRESYDNGMANLNYSKNMKSKKAIKKEKKAFRTNWRLSSSSSSLASSKNVSSNVSEESIKETVFKIDESVKNYNTINASTLYDDLSSQYQPYNTLTHITPYSSAISSNSSTISYFKTDAGNYVTTCQVIPVYSLTAKNYSNTLDLSNFSIDEESGSELRI